MQVVCVVALADLLGSIAMDAGPVMCRLQGTRNTMIAAEGLV